MKGARKLKIALDETRMLVLGSQVLLGFQLRGPFEKRFDELTSLSKTLHAASLLIMVLVIGLLIAAGLHHRLVDHGHATWRMQRAISRLMAVTLALFAISLTVNLFVAFDVMFDPLTAKVAALGTAVTASLLWFGIEILYGKARPMATSNEHVSLPERIDQMLTEARVVLPGAQALLGFQLAVVLTDSFAALGHQSKWMHGLALAGVTLSTILLMAPAAYHRIVYAGDASTEFLRLGSIFLVAATAALAVGIAADVFVVIAKIADSQTAGKLAALGSLLVLVAMWHVSPLLMRKARNF